jgi:hypothetical protein
MKPETLHEQSAVTRDDAALTDASAEAALRREIGKLRQWLVAHGIDPQTDHTNMHQGSRDRLYVRYGLFIGLKQALELLTGRGEAVH